MIGGVIGPSVAGAQHAGEGLVGLVEVTDNRMKAEPSLVVRRSILFVRVAGEQGGVDVDGDR